MKKNDIVIVFASEPFDFMFKTEHGGSYHIKAKILDYDEGKKIIVGISYAKRLPKDSADAQNMIKNAIDVDYVAIGSIKLDKN